MGGFPRRLVAGLVVAAALGSAACATTPATPAVFHLVPAPEGAPGFASAKIAAWQARAQREPAGIPAAAPGSLGASFEAFVAAQRRAQADEVRAWIQAEAERSYRADPGFDQWPTFREILASKGDDCDGLELLTLHALRALGFPEDALFRAVIARREDGVQHMVTLWFESPGNPLVIDPTGFATRALEPLSALDAWQAQAVFDEQAHYGMATSELAPAGSPR